MLYTSYDSIYYVVSQLIRMENLDFWKFFGDCDSIKFNICSFNNYRCYVLLDCKQLIDFNAKTKKKILIKIKRKTASTRGT